MVLAIIIILTVVIFTAFEIFQWVQFYKETKKRLKVMDSISNALLRTAIFVGTIGVELLFILLEIIIYLIVVKLL